MKLGRGVVLPSDASILSHVFRKYFRQFLNQQAFKFLHGVDLAFDLLILGQSPLQALFGVELGVSSLIYVFKNF